MLNKQEPQQKKVTAMLTISCGCGFRPTDTQEAKKHAEETGHVLTLHGVIGSQERLSRARLVG